MYKKYTNTIAESNILEIWTFKNESKIQVLFKIKNRKTYRFFSGHEIARFLNYTTEQNLNLKQNTVDRKNNFTISANIKQGIVKDIKSICKEDGRYSYKTSVLSPDEQYKELFKGKQAIEFYPNYYMKSNISKIAKLKNRFKKILGFDPQEGLCHSLSYFIVLLELKNKEDFDKFFKSNYDVSEQDFVAYIDGRKRQTATLFTMNILTQCLPVFDIQSIKNREGESFYDEVIYARVCQDSSLMRKQIKSALEGVEVGRYLEFIFECGACCKKNDIDNSDYTSDSNLYNCTIDDNYGSAAHSTLVYKEENGKYIFFDSNKGAVGFHHDTGAANLTSEEMCEILELALNCYLYCQYIKDFPIFPNNCFIYAGLQDATLMLKKAEKFYETTKTPRSKIVDISVDKQTNQLLFMPASV